MKRRIIYWILLFCMGIWNQASSQSEKNTVTGTVTKPNIVFILIDDIGYSDVGCYGSDYYETPNIDKLAREGIRFTDAYAASTLCSPTRASILTGKYPGRLHITHAIPIYGSARLKNTMFLDADYVMNLPLKEVTIAEALKEKGYRSASIGKWHVSWNEKYYPEKQGFDVNIGGNNMGSPGNYFYPYNGKWSMTDDSPVIEWNVLPNGESGEYLTDRLTNEAVKFIEESKEKPFFLYLQHYAVHTPLQSKEELIKKYEAKPANLVRGHKNARYAAMIESVDQSVGRVMKKLADLRLIKNTIVIFTSDNGGQGRSTTNWPFRGNKGNFYEGGIRVPLIVKWLENIKPGIVNNTPVTSTDFYPTLLGLTGIPLKPKQHLDGINLAPLLTQEKKIARNDALYWHFPNYTGTGHPNPIGPCSAIRDGDWKLIEYLEDGSLELYNLKEDIKEENNLAKQLPGQADELRKKLEKWRKNVQVQMPRPNPNYKGNIR